MVFDFWETIEKNNLNFLEHKFLKYLPGEDVDDFDAWKEEHCTLEEIMKVVGANKNSFHKILKELIHIMNDEKIEYVKENQNVVVSDRTKLSQKNLEVLDVILK